MYKIKRLHNQYVRKTIITKRCQKLIKKQIGLLAMIAFIVTFMAFTGVASAQTSNAQITFFTQPGCAACQAAEPIVNSAAAKYGVAVTVVDLSTTVGKNIAQATGGITTTPTIIVSGAQSATFVGSVTQAQLESSITAAKGLSLIHIRRCRRSTL